MAKLCDMLSSVIEDTKGRIEKKQAQTYEELLAEQQEGQEVRCDTCGLACCTLGCMVAWMVATRQRGSLRCCRVGCMAGQGGQCAE